MAGLFDIGVSGLTASQRSLATVSHNISNVNTEGFSRQRVELDARKPQGVGNIFIGKGVETSAVLRMADKFLIGQVRTALTNQRGAEAFNTFASQINNLLADADTGISSALQDFFDGIQAVADDPASIPARQVMLAEAETLTSRFHHLDARLTEINRGVNQQLELFVNDINSLAKQIANINKDIAVALGRAQGQPPNDLLDQRDKMLSQLSEIIGIQTFEQKDGAVNVVIGNGQSLVVGTTSLPLSLINDPLDTSRKQVAYGFGATQSSISNSLTSGKIGGVLDFRRTMLEPTRNELGRLGAAIAQSVNLQHRDGMDLNGALGADFFSFATPKIVPAVTNTGTVTIAFNETDIGSLTASDYQLTHDGVNFTLTRLSDGSSQTLVGAGPFNVEGMTITIGVGPAAGDSYFIQPTRDVAASIARVVTRPEDIAAAIPVRTGASFNNIGNASISDGQVLDVTDPNLLNTVTIDFSNPPTTYQINGAGPLLPFTGGGNIDVNGWRVQISGNPQPGDQFVVQSNIGGVSDNRNAIALADLRIADILDGGTATYQDTYSQLTADVGTQTRQSEISNKALQVLLDQSNQARDEVSGVNLDEEAANLLRFQQAYQASAQVVATADSIFQTLLDAVRR
jgi:flagellar hook-associated protein 1 FlgK